ncbi:MAG: YdeI/OmpD-associated family protein [Nocardioidaceae bacterium]
MTEQVPIELFASPEELRAWLRENQDAGPGVWLRFARKGSRVSTLTYDEALGVALAFGWIDSQVRRFDDDTYLQRFTPRRARSPWSMRNRRKAEQMIEAGEMEPSGLAEVERARADGRWDKAYEGQRSAEMPRDFLAALEQNPAAEEFYATLNSQNRYAIYYRVQEAKRPETRARRIERFVGMLARGETFH